MPWPKGIKQSEESSRKRSLAMSGRKSSDATKEKMRIYHTGLKLSKETKDKLRAFNLGKIMPEDVKRKISEANKKKIHTPEHNKKVSLSLTGKKLSKEHRAALSRSHMGINKGEKCHLWKGGISANPYSVDWNKTLKRAIRERDRFTCQVCSSVQEGQRFDVHHIDYDKKNSDPSNLITLCHICHMKTNSKREFWIKFFNSKKIV